MEQKKRSYFSLWRSGVWLSSIAIFFTGCLHLSAPDDPLAAFQGQSLTALYRTAETEFEKGNYEKAVKIYEALEILYPFNVYSEETFVRLIESYYHIHNLPAVISAAQRFLRLYPTSTQIETVYYLKGLAHFYQDRKFFVRFIKLDLSYRYPGEMQFAYQSFAELVHLFPESIYTPEAKQYMEEMRELFAQYELHIAEFYLEKKAYIAAFNRVNELIARYPESRIIAQAKQIQATAKQALALGD